MCDAKMVQMTSISQAMDAAQERCHLDESTRACFRGIRLSLSSGNSDPCAGRTDYWTFCEKCEKIP